MQLMVIYGLLVSFIFAKVCDAQVSCKDENNTNIDWFIILKNPDSFNFQYLSSKNKKWKLSKEDISSDRNMLAHTLKQSRDSNTFYANYNGAADSKSIRRGHLNGFLSFAKTSGFWIIHSVPKFIPKTTYEYPETGKKFGQSFICVTVNLKYLTDIAKQLLIMKSTIYSYNLPGNMFQDQSLMKMLQYLVSNENYNFEQMYNAVTFKTSDNLILYHLAKSEKYEKDPYTEFIAKTLKSSIYVETWRRTQSVPSNCANKYKVYNVEFVNLAGQKYKYTKDHSVWAVTDSKSQPYICVGDINRMKINSKRGEGTLCIKDFDSWNTFKEIVDKYEKCDNWDLWR